jgi:flagellar hook-associated protein 2
MATTATTSSTSLSSATTSALASSPAAVAKANKANAQKLVTSLGAGSGVDVSSLAQNLVDAERVPKENAINAKITKNESRISGYAAMSFVLTGVQTALTALKDQNNFNALGVANSDSAAFTVATSATGSAGSHQIEVLRLAKAQRTVSDGLASDTASVNGGLAMSLSLNVGSPSPVATTIQIAAGKDTPQDIVTAINDAKTGVTAKVVNTGDGSANPYQIVLSGAMGSAGAFSLTPNYLTGSGSPGLSFTNGNSANQVASDSLLKVDGITYTRTDNTIVDVVPGLTLGLKALSANPATIDVTRDNTGIKDKLAALVTAYNDAQTIFTAVSDPKSTLDTYGATLVGDSSVRSVKQQLRQMIMGQSSTPGTSVGALWQIGLSVDMQGVMSLDSAKLDTVLASNYSDVVKTFTGNKNGLSVYSSAPAGVAGDAVKKISQLLGKTGILQSQSDSATTQNTKYKDDLTKLQTRMDALLTRYQKQFSAMDSLVGGINTQKTSLKSTFDGMMANLTGKSG